MNRADTVTSPESAAARIAIVFIAITTTLFLLTIATGRFIAKDEGFYMLAGSLVARGQSPYLDFFYPQMPLYPTFLAWAFKLFGESWLAARSLSAGMTALAVTVLFVSLQRKTGTLAATLGVVLIVTSNLFYPWFVLAKTYAPTLLCIAVAFLLSDRREISKPATLLVGAALGLATAMRLPMAGTIIAFPIIFSPLRNSQRIFLFLLGATLPLLGSCSLFIQDPSAFLFNNLGYHQIRELAPTDTALSEKLSTLLSLFGLRSTRQIEGFQFRFLLFGACAHILVRRWHREEIDPAFWIGAVMLAIHIAPTPIYLQYFCMVVPWWGYCTALAIHDICGARALAIVASAAITFAYLLPVPKGVAQYTKTGAGVIGIDSPERAETWRLSTIDAIAQSIKDTCGAGASVLALWPGHLIGTEAQAVPGYENQFALQKGAPALRANQRKQLKIPSINDLIASIESRSVPCIVVERRTAKRFRITPSLQAHYTKVQDIADVGIFRARQDVPKDTK